MREWIRVLQFFMLASTLRKLVYRGKKIWVSFNITWPRVGENASVEFKDMSLSTDLNNNYIIYGQSLNSNFMNHI